jgi:hypothetical protein
VSGGDALGAAAALGARLRERDLAAAPAALNLLENRAPARREEIAALLAEGGSAARRPLTSSASPDRRAPASRRC